MQQLKMQKRKLLLILFVALIVSSLSGCGSKAPQPPEVERCYLRRNTDSQKVEAYCIKTKSLITRVKSENEVIGDFTVSPEDFTKGEIYQKDLEAWGYDHCK